jgi:hypothetical protein
MGRKHPCAELDNPVAALLTQNPFQVEAEARIPGFHEDAHFFIQQEKTTCLLKV